MLRSALSSKKTNDAENRDRYEPNPLEKIRDPLNDLSRFFHALPEKHIRLLRRRFGLVS
jgi:hypothetical protein